jgi:ATP-binding cassette subfamily B protein RaxB
MIPYGAGPAGNHHRGSAVRQTEVAECGLACLGIAAEHFGSQVDLSVLRQKYQIPSRGLTLKQIKEIAADMQLVGRAVQCELDELAELRCPAILHWGLNHFVVLLRARGKRYRIHDPALGVLDLDRKKVSRQFTGIAMELAPAPSFTRRMERSPLQLASWFRLTPGMYGALAQVVLLSLLLQVYVLASPLYVQLALDQGALKGDQELLWVLALGFGMFCVFNACGELLRGIVVARLTALLNVDMSLRLFRHLLRLPLPWFQRRKLADILSRFDAIGPIRELMSGVLVVTLVDGALAVVTLVMMFVVSPSLAWMVVAGLAVYVVIRLCSMPVSLRLSMAAITARIAENGKRIESIRAIQTLKVMGAERERESDWANKFAMTVKADQANTVANAVFGTAQSLCDHAVRIALIFVGAHAIMRGDMSVGLFYSFLSYQAQFSAKASNLFEQAVKWRMTDIFSHRLADIVLTPQEPDIDRPGTAALALRGEVEFSQLGFAYSNFEQAIFRDVTLRIAPGEFVAIVGASGSGKSTLLKVLCGLYPATSGEVRIDGRTLASWGAGRIRQAFGVVMQDDELLSGTIAENVAFFSDDIDMDLVWECLRHAAIEDDVLRLPLRDQTLIGDMGTNLSGGQKQRLLLARALYRRPAILVLDEATSHLDVARERQVNQALQAMRITRIVVAHRHETIAAADRIVRLENGRIVSDQRVVRTTPEAESAKA